MSRRLAFLAVVVALFGGASASAAPGVVPHALVGTWKSTTAAFYSITIKSNGRVTFKRGTQRMYETVSWTPTRATFGPAGACSGKGTYRWKVVGSRLTFRVITDRCIIRSGFLRDTWTRR